MSLAYSSNNEREIIKKVKGSFSRTRQESFVLNILENKHEGFFEIGGCHSTQISNTYLLETQQKFRGIALGINESCCQEYNTNRVNPCWQSDARKFNYKKYFVKNGFPNIIGYLQCDIERAVNTLLSIVKATSTGYRFSKITFEHDQYLSAKNKVIASLSRIYMIFRGYKLVIKNISNEQAPGLFHEDSCIDPRIFPNQQFKALRKKNICSTELFID